MHQEQCQFCDGQMIIQDLLLHKRHSDKIIVLGGQALIDYKGLGLFHVDYFMPKEGMEITGKDLTTKKFIIYTKAGIVDVAIYEVP